MHFSRFDRTGEYRPVTLYVVAIIGTDEIPTDEENHR